MGISAPLLSHPRASLELFALAKHSMLELLALARRSSMSDLKGKVAVATGASKGIGAAIAKGLSCGRRPGHQIRRARAARVR
jgi:hypothetical protein